MNDEPLTQKRIALLGGAFNPPHLGHVLIARQVLDFAGVDEVWLLPNYGQSFEKPVAPWEDRLAMTRMISLPHVIVSTIEIDHQLDGRTIHLLPYLPPGNEYVFVMGSDQLPVFHLWGSYRELLERMKFLVFPRFGYPLQPLFPNMTVLSHELLMTSDISSTKIRGRVSAGLSIAGFVPEGVEEYIINHGLYKP